MDDENGLDEERDAYKDLPISDYLKPHIVGVRTFMRTGKWWRAAVMLRDQKSGNSYVSLYLWEKRTESWKRRSSYTIRRREDAKAIQEYLADVLDQIE